MERLKAFGIKLIVILVITFSLFGIFNHVSLMNLILISIVITGVTFIGDMIFLPRINNFVVIVGDFVLFALLFWGLGTMFVEATMPIVLVSLAAAYLATMAEAIIHIYINERVFEDSEQSPQIIGNLQTEFAEETEAQDIKGKIQTAEKEDDE